MIRADNALPGRAAISARAVTPAAVAAPRAVRLVGLLVLLSFAGLVGAQNTPELVPAPSAPGKPAASAQVSYTGGQLKIEALNVTLAELLAKVTALTGVKIEVPAGVSTEPMPMVKLGPGPARSVLATLLSDSSLDYLIQASDKDPGELRAVLILIRDKRVGADPAGHPVRSPYARAAAPASRAEEAAAPDVAAGAAPAAQDPAAAPPPEQPVSPPSPDADRSARIPLSQPDQLARTGRLSPPATLNPETISQQLQQMYQQRVLINQQERQAVPQPANSGSK